MTGDLQGVAVVGPEPVERQSIDLAITGMTCAACATRIEKKLNRIDGVVASVNYATEQARVTFDPSVLVPGQLVDTVESIGYGAALPPAEPSTLVDTDIAHPGGVESTPPPDAHLASLRQRLIVSAMLGLPVLLLSMIPMLQFRNWQWISFALASPVATWGAWPFHRTAWKNLRQAEATMDTLVSVGVIAAYGWSTWALLATEAGDSGMKMPMSLRVSRGTEHHLYLEVASAVVALILAGRYFETRSKRRASGAIRSLLELAAKEASLLGADGTETRIAAEKLQVGDRFVVRPGEQVAADGIIDSGTSAIDASLVTGESLPVDVGPGAPVVGGTLNAGGRLVVRATRVGRDTQVAQMARLVEEAQTGKAPIQRLADRVASVFVPVVIVIAVATLGFWFARTGSMREAFGPAVAVAIIACPCALGLATPTALLVGTARGARRGILIKGPEVLESTRRIDTIVFDKTGTLTSGRMTVEQVEPSPGWSANDVAAVAGAVESASEHPIARAIVEFARAESLALDVVEAFVSRPGLGAQGRVGGRQVSLGRGVAGPVETTRQAMERSGATVVTVWVDDEVVGVISVRDAVKPDAADAVARLVKMGIRPMLLSGDNSTTAATVGGQVGIAENDIRAEVLPEGKVAEIRRLQAEGRVVAMVGDGVNDAAALAQADLGIAMGAGTDVAIEASDLTIVRDDLGAVVDAVRLSRRTLATIKGNLFWAFGYNVAAIPLAATGFLSPAIAGAAMAFSSVFVVSNSLRLRRFR